MLFKLDIKELVLAGDYPFKEKLEKSDLKLEKEMQLQHV